MPQEFAIPGVDHLGRSGRAQRGVALLQDARVALPAVDEGGFHVEHRPIEPAAAPGAAFLDEPMDAGLNDLNRERLRELRQRSHGNARDLG